VLERCVFARLGVTVEGGLFASVATAGVATVRVASAGGAIVGSPVIERRRRLVTVHPLGDHVTVTRGRLAPATETLTPQGEDSVAKLCVICYAFEEVDTVLLDGLLAIAGCGDMERIAEHGLPVDTHVVLFAFEIHHRRLERCHCETPCVLSKRTEAEILLLVSTLVTHLHRP